MNLSKFGYQKLTVYQKAKEFVLIIYQITKTYPKDEQFILVPQMRRAAISIAANIVEGYSKNSTKEYIRFLNIAIGSATELRVFLDISKELGYLSQTKITSAESLLEEILKLLYSYQKTLRNRI